jgi:type IV fimbrial biogenesis protein FimT
VSKFLARREAGFTLLEVIVVMALIAIVSAVAVLSMAFYIPNVRLKSATQEINIQLQKARLEAIRRGDKCHVEFHKTIGTKTYSPYMWLDSNNNDVLDTGEELYGLEVISKPAPHIWEFENFRGVRFDDGKGTNGIKDFFDKSFVINQRGLVDDAGSIHLRNARGGGRSILITLGGAVRVY